MYFRSSPYDIQRYREQTERSVSGPSCMAVRKTCGNGCGRLPLAGGRVIGGKFYCACCAEAGRLPDIPPKKAKPRRDKSI